MLYCPHVALSNGCLITITIFVFCNILPTNMATWPPKLGNMLIICDVAICWGYIYLNHKVRNLYTNNV